MTHYTSADLAMVKRHIALGEGQIIQQERMLSWLRAKDQPTAKAEALLRLLNEAQTQHQAHGEAIAKALAEAAPS